MNTFRSRIMMAGFFLGLGLFLTLLPDGLATEPQPLELEKALLIDGSEGLDLSALAFKDGRLYTLSDKVDNTLYRIVLGKNSTRLVPHLKFDPATQLGARKPLDWEALAIDPAGNFYLGSERMNDVALLTSNGKICVWLSTDAAKFFPPGNSGLEGLALLASSSRNPSLRLILAREREPRGLLDTAMARKNTPRWQVMDTTDYPPRRNRVCDFADLWSEYRADRFLLLALARNAECIVELLDHEGAWTEGRAWSYAAAVNDPRYAYLADPYGTAEGLALDAKHIYLVIDNNRSGRVADPKDRRSTLFIFKRPADLMLPLLSDFERAHPRDNRRIILDKP